MDTDPKNSRDILLVEDDGCDVELMLAALAASKHVGRVTVVDDGAEALDYLNREGKFEMRAGGNPIFVLLDNKMPKVDGIEVLRFIKSDEALRMIPVVVFSSSREKSDLQEFYEYGVNAYVVKPVDVSEFMNVVRQIMTFWGTANEPPLARQGEGAIARRGREVMSEQRA
jgi:CheY-like chemotaxis protein